MPVNITHSN